MPSFRRPLHQTFSCLVFLSKHTVRNLLAMASNWKVNPEFGSTRRKLNCSDYSPGSQTVRTEEHVSQDAAGVVRIDPHRSIGVDVTHEPPRILFTSSAASVSFEAESVMDGDP